MKLVNLFLTLVGAIVFYFVYYTLLKSVLPVLPDLTLWRYLDLTTPVLNYKLPLFDLLLFLFGLIVFSHGVVRLAMLTDKGHSINDEDLDNGEFGKIRHPMFGTFMIIELGLFLSLCSLYGVLLLVVIMFFQITMSIYEDQFVLKQKFHKRYDEYRAAVKRRFFTPLMSIYFLLAVIFVGGGIYYMFQW